MAICYREKIIIASWGENWREKFTLAGQNLYHVNASKHIKFAHRVPDGADTDLLAAVYYFVATTEFD